MTTSLLNASEDALKRKYLLEADDFWLTGTQALVRMVLEQHQRDQRSDLNTTGYITGYRGSPLAGLDFAFSQAQSALDERNIVFQPAVNEDLGATAVWGAQQVGLFDSSRYDGVFSMWYGKSPGLDRSADAIRHANMAGTAPMGGVLAMVGDDPDCKSSTLPSDSAGLLRDLQLPIVDPTDIGELIDYGLYGWALSRFSGCWVAMLAQTSVMDSSASILRSRRPSFEYPNVDVVPHIRLNDTPHDQERRMSEKLALVHAFQHANPINAIVVDADKPKLSIVTMGKSYTNVRQALRLFGLDSHDQIRDAGIRLIKLGLIWPVDRVWLREQVRDSQAVLVVESKSAFLETELKSALYGHAHVPVLGKEDLHGKPLLTPYGELQIASILDALMSLKSDLALTLPNVAAYESTTDENARALSPMNMLRKPLFCPGCPHAGSTKLPEGSRAFAGIGCHYMAQWMHRETYLFTHMGGEGANWIGQAPFTDTDHVFVNMGDGTYGHSGLLAIRASVAANVNVTYKILFNEAVAMTGGQAVEGDLTVADVVAQVRAEGVNEVEVVAESPRTHRGASYPVSPRSELNAVQRRLRNVPGCSVIVVDHACATETRRKRKRGLLPPSERYVVINEDVCEGCGDCVAKSGCSAIKVVQTEFGEKRQIEQSHCVQDLTCVEGYCPAIVVVNGRPKDRLPATTAINVSIPEVDVPATANVLVAGVGGTGVITLSHVLAMAAYLDGKQVSTLDMTGLAQKGGAVISHLRISEKDVWRTRLSEGECDVLVAADAVTASSYEVVPLLDAERTHAIVNSSLAPSHTSVIDGTGDHAAQDVIGDVSKAVSGLSSLDAVALSDKYAGTATVANMVLLGCAYQRGLLPVSLSSVQRAITINGVAIEANIAAFNAGRLSVVEGGQFDQETKSPETCEMPVDLFITRRVDLLKQYANADFADLYMRRIEDIRNVEKFVLTQGPKLTRTVADVLYRFMAVKDEYEVARLLSQSTFNEHIDDRFTDAKVEYAFAPTWIKGRRETTKVRLGSWFKPVLRGLAGMRFVRGSLLDPFRFSSERKLDQQILKQLESDLDLIVNRLNEKNHQIALNLLLKYNEVKGFGYIREASWQRASTELQLLRATLEDAVGVEHFEVAAS